MKKKYIVCLSDEEKSRLLDITKKGKSSARQIRRAQILLFSDAGEIDQAIAETLNTTAITVANVRKRYTEHGLDFAISERPRPGRPPVLDARQDALLVAHACSNPPEGMEKWTMQLLADRLVTLGIVEQISDETVRLRLKKTKRSPGSKTNGASRM